MVTTNYSISRFLDEYKFPDLEKQTFTYVIPNSAVGLANAALPSYEYDMDYVTNGVRKTGKFIKFFTRPDIMFTAINTVPNVASTNTPPSVVNNNSINGLQTLGLSGPGVIHPSANMNIVFIKVVYQCTKLRMCHWLTTSN